MTKLTSGRVEKVDSANVSADRYQFLSLKEAEPDLGLPTTAGQVFTSNTTGSRYWTTLDTGNVVETSNLYYSNARVLSNVSLMSINVFADVNITGKQAGYGLVWDGNTWVANVITVSGTELSNVANTVLTIVQSQIAGLQANNAIFANTAAVANVAGLANVSIFANVAGLANVANTVISISNFTTANLLEGSNLYYTNARSRAAISAGTGITYDAANGIITANLAGITATINNLTTTDIEEGANLYFTNARVLTALSNATIQGNLTVTNTISANTLNVGNITTGAGAGGTISGLDRLISNIIIANSITINGVEIVNGSTGEANINATRINTNSITANIWTGLYTANVIETGSNLYYTNTRSRTALSAGSGIIYDTANGIITANTASILSGLSATVTGLTTANVAEASSNLYYTNARSRLAISAGTGVIYDTANGIISIGQNVSTTSDVIFNRVTILSNLSVYGNVTTFASNNLSISDNMIYLNSNSIYSNPDLGFAGNYNDGTYRHTGFFRDATDGTWKVFDNYTPEPDANIFIDTAHASFRLANFAANIITANALNVGNITTGGGAGGTISGLDRLSSNVIIANSITINGVEIVNGSTGEANIAATRINTNSISANIWNGLYTANVIETSGNLYFTNTRSRASLSAGTGIIYDTANGIISANTVSILSGLTATVAGLTTANVAEAASNLYFTNARVLTALSNQTIQGNLTVTNTINANILNVGNITTGGGAGGTISGLDRLVSNVIVANSITINGVEIVTGGTNEANIVATRITSNIWNNLYTANVIETSGNLYFTNSRVLSALSNATIQGNLTINNILISNGLIVNGVEIVTGGSGEANITASRLTTNIITANIWNGLYTGNIIETPGNLYFTNARTRVAISAGTGIAYDSVTGVISATGSSNLSLDLANILPAYTGNIGAGNINITGRLFANGITINGTEIISGNTNEANINVSRITANVGIFANLITGNLTLGNLNTGNLVIGSGQGGNLTGVYILGTDYANINSNLIVGNINTTGIIIANELRANIFTISLTTANVAEATSNLYFTNARVLSALSNANIQGNLTINNILIANGIIINGIEIVTSGSNESNIFATRINANSITANSITANIWIGLYTANVIETSGNLYFTNARSRAAISAGTGIIYDTANGIITANTASILSGLSATVAGLTTANVSENAASGNLYYTNARVRTAVSAGTGVSYDNTTGIISIGQNVSTTSDVTFNKVTVLSNLTVYGNVTTFASNNLSVSDNMIYLNSNSLNSNPDLGFAGNYNDGTYRHTGFFRDASDGIWKVFDNYTPEPDANIFIDTAHASFRLANFAANIITANNILLNGTNLTAYLNAVADIIDLTTANVNELASSGNLYYSNARARSALSQGPGISYDPVTGIISSNTTANVTAIISALTTANIAESAASGNLYYTNARVYSNVITLLSNIQGIIRATGNITTDGNLIANGLIIRNINVSDSVLAGNITSNTSSSSNVTANTITTHSITANIWNRLYTANVIETASNLYFTNARVYANVFDLLPYYTGNLNFGNVNAVNRITANILDIGPLSEGGTISGANTIATTTIVANSWIGIYTANVIETGQSIYYTNARVYSNISQMSVNVLADVDITGINTNQILVWDGTKFIPGNTGTSGLASNTALTTANVAELPSNLYYTNLRAYSNVISLLPYYTGTLSANNITATNSATVGNLIVLGNLFVSGNTVNFYANSLVVNDPMIQLGYGNPGDLYDLGFIGHYNDGAIERHAGFFRDHSDQKFKIFDNLTSEPGLNDIDTANATFRLAVVAAKTYEGNLIGNVTGYVSSISNFTTSNLVEGTSLYFTNARVYANIAPLLTTANVTEIASNLYFTNTRVYANIAPLLTTANVNEIASSGNLYYTNARVYANVTERLSNLNMNIIPSANNVYNLGSPTARFKSLYLSGNTIDLGGVTLSATNTDGLVIDTISSNVWNKLYTANVIETASNLYFTNARVYANIAPLLTTANVAEVTNLYFTNTRVYANISPLLTTANVAEVTNLYFTNTRVLTALSNATIQGNLTVTNTINANALAIGSGAGGTLTGIANLTVTNTVTANTISANTLSIGAGAGGTIAGANLISATFIQANIWNGLYTANIIESNSNLFYTNVRTRSALSAGAGIIYDNTTGIITANLTNITANVTATINGLTTANVAEAASNLYYTNVRVNAYVQPWLTTANVAEITNLYYSNARVFSNIAPLLTTANVAEITNLYYSNARVYSNVITLLANLLGGIRATGNIQTDGNLIANGLIIRNINVSDNVLAGNITANATTSNAIVAVTVYATGNITTDANLIANGLIIRNINVSDSVLTGSISSGNTTSNVILADSITANTWNRLYTANVIETSGNLYFTNTRAISAFTAGKNIQITSQGVIRSTSGSTDYFNTAIDNSVGYTVTNLMGNALVFPSVQGYKYTLRSLHVTNISSNATYVNGNIYYSTQNTNVPFLNEIYIPVGTSVELIRRPHVFSPGDIVRLQGYDGTNFVSSTISATLTYETIPDDPSYYSTGQVLPTANSNIILLQPSPSVIMDSLKFVNLYSTDAAVTAIWANESNTTKSYYSFNMLVPASSTVEILQAAKRLAANDKIIVNYSNIPDGYMSAFVSYKSNIGVSANVSSNVDQGGNISINLFASTPALGSTLYYTIDPS